MSPISDSSTTASTVTTGSASTILCAMYHQVLAESAVWLVAAAVIIVCDLYFGCEAAKRRGERVRLSRAVRRTINKACEYLCWVLLGTVLSLSFSADWIRQLVLGVIFGNELTSCLTNYFESKGKRIKLNIFKLLGRKFNLPELEDVNVEQLKNGKDEKDDDPAR